MGEDLPRDVALEAAHDLRLRLAFCSATADIVDGGLVAAHPCDDDPVEGGSGLGAVRCIVEYADAWLLANKRLDRRNDRLTNIIDALLTTACIFVIANRITD
jgi:hypothetical protein